MCSGKGQARLVVRRGLCLAPRGYSCTPHGRSGQEFHSSGRRAGMAGGAGDRCPRTAGLGGVRSPGRPPPSKGARERALGNSERRSHSQAQGTEKTERPQGPRRPRWRGGKDTSACHAGVSLARALGRYVLDKDKVKACVREGLGRGWGSEWGEVLGDKHDRPPPQLGTALPHLGSRPPPQPGKAGQEPCAAANAGPQGPPAEPSRARARCWHPRAAAASPPAR